MLKQIWILLCGWPLLLVVGCLGRTELQPTNTDESVAAGDEMGKKTWGLSNTLTTGGTAQMITVQTGDLSAEGYSMWTIQFGVDPPSNGLGYDATATINFVVNGNPIRRVVSVGQGVELSGAADAISVQVIDSTPAGYNNANQTYTVGVNIVPGTRASTTQPLLRDVAAGAGRDVQGKDVLQVPVPANSGVVGMWLVAAGAATPFVEVLQLVGPLALFPFSLQDQVPRFVPLVPSVNSLFFINQVATSSSLAIIWVIDG